MKFITVFIFLIFTNALSANEMKGYLTKEDIALFYKQGYLLKKGCLSKKKIKTLKVQVDKVIDRSLNCIKSLENIKVTDEDQITFLNGSRIVFKKKPNNTFSIARINGVTGIEPKLTKTVRSDKMVHTFFEILNTTELEHLISQIHPKMPSDGIAYPKHRDIQFRKSFDPDWQDILGNGSYAICIIPIDPMSKENGGLWIDQNNYPDDKSLPENLTWIEASPGDLLFMHPYLFHGSGPNLSPTASRKTLLTGFAAFGANHKAYPGADVNVHLTLQKEGTITSQPAPWGQKPLTTDGHH